MHQDRRTADDDIVRVELLDGEVVAVGCAGGRLDGCHSGVLAVGAGEFVARLEVVGADPGVGGGVPEGVVGRGVEGGRVSSACVDGDVEEVVVVVDPDVLDGASAAVFAGGGVGGLYFVADLDLADRLLGSICQEYRGAGVEAALGCTGLVAGAIVTAVSEDHPACEFGCENRSARTNWVRGTEGGDLARACCDAC